MLSLQTSQELLSSLKKEQLLRTVTLQTLLLPCIWKTQFYKPVFDMIVLFIIPSRAISNYLSLLVIRINVAKETETSVSELPLKCLEVRFK